ncbi:dipeptide ABC transporter ATP-binding protein [Aurantimonas aggregata]|uniref:Dipeptide ABC transporter ATP-binding protein n=1 Tax=Aurantimonas aggregata TaxID=2047720 RepID=A0A6L9MGH7_9HYPH|nr:ABC transporter ATP-binding protein [Aurantimonas aggregata]NDV86758.1 dipeptide ABC transporter ATP-binding protein [Aurantimonas aggregata]
MSQTEREPVLVVDGLTVELPKSGDRPHAVEELSFRVNAGEIVCIVGESGSGKSVTAFTTMGLLPKALKPSAGRVVFEGCDILTMRPREHARLRGNRMAMIFQEPMTSLNPCFTVGDQIEEVFKAHSSIGKAERKAKTLALMEEVHLPDVDRIYRSYPHQLSGGQRQRIVIALALAMNPSLLIADEPTTALDVTTQAQILLLMKRLKDTHDAGILFVTHDFDVVAEIADRVVVMEKGRIVEEGLAEQVLSNPQHPYTRQLIAAVPPRRSAEPVPLPADAETVLEVRGLAKTFHVARTFLSPERTVHAVRPATFSLKRGETLGIVGESGSGKTTLVRTLIRLIEPDGGGETLIGGTDFAALPKEKLRRFRSQIQIVFQDPYGSLNPRRTIGDQLVSAPINFGMAKDEAWKRAHELMRIVRLDPEVLARYPSQFSGGQRQRICIARALMMEPKILIADEAVSALDVSVQKEVLQLLKDVRDRMGLTMLFITHDLRVAAQISDRIAVMKNGEIVEIGTARAIFEHSTNDYTKSLLASMPGMNWDVPQIEPASA